jgi:SagB-type dehydrogenase family enzyme
MPRMPQQFGFLCSTLDDPRRIELRQTEILTTFQQRGDSHDLIETAHDLTKIRRTDDSQVVDAVLLFQRPFMHSVQYTHDRDYPLQPTIRLPKPKIPDRSFGELIRGRRSARDFGCDPLGLPQLSSLLYGAMGETGHMVTDDDRGQPVSISLRTIPSGGALQPTGIFAIILQRGVIAQGLYHYDVPEHSLEFVKPLGDLQPEKLFARFPNSPGEVAVRRASVIFFIASKFWRARAKYGPRGYRYCLQEAGCACQNLGLMAHALGLAHVVIGGFYDDEVHAFLGIDGVEHAVITAVAVGTLPKKRTRGGRHATVST